MKQTKNNFFESDTLLAAAAVSLWKYDHNSDEFSKTCFFGSYFS